jgi:aldehyde dehydrogenase (NAD+)
MNFKTDVNYRRQTLIKLLDVIQTHEDEIIAALGQDFKKPAFEGLLTETFIVISELKSTIRNLKNWSRPKRIRPSVLNFPSTDYLYREPYGSVLVIAPWNYPFQLAMAPMIAAVAAGNSVTVKPSELTPNTSAMIAEIVRLAFDPNHVEVYQGGAEVSQKLLTHRWDYIFFTGSVSVGKIVARAAAENLTPVTLELGGKNPCIVDATANIALAAKRIVWGKFINAGQTCIAPDYILVQNKVKSKFVNSLIEEITKAYGENPELSPDFARIINAKNWNRLLDMIDTIKILYGGQSNSEDHYLAPTLIDEPSLDSDVMKEEIFGPVLPIVSYENEHEIETILSRYEKPLSLYVFSDSKAFGQKIITNFSFGGGCINDTVIHFGNARLPFGGVGFSGMGAYHGRFSFETFSHRKPIVRKANWLDLPMRYAPYGNKIKSIRKLLKWI